MMSGVGGERVRVAMRVRPLMSHETTRGDENIITCPDNQHVLLNLKTGTKSYRFNAVLGDRTKQSEVFNLCGVHVRNLNSLMHLHIGIARLFIRRLLGNHICLWIDWIRKELFYCWLWQE